MSCSIYAYFLCNYVHSFLSASRTSVERPAVFIYRSGDVWFRSCLFKGMDQIHIFKKTLKQPLLGCLENEGGAEELSEKSTMLSGGNSEK